jgi:hypothetical protein
MSTTKTFLKNYLPTARSIITQPRRFYQDMPVSEVPTKIFGSLR